MKDAKTAIVALAEANLGLELSNEIPRCVALLRQWADRLEARGVSLNKSLAETQDMIQYAASQLEKMEGCSREDSSVFRTACSSLKVSCNSLARTLKDVKQESSAAQTDLSPPEKLEEGLLRAEDAGDQLTKLSEVFRERLRACDFSEHERRSSKAKKSDQEKRQRSPTRRSAA